MNTAKKQSFGMSVVLLIMGIVLLIWSDSALKAVSIVIGIGCLCEAAMTLFSGISEKQAGYTVLGVLLLIVGLIFVVHPQFLISILPVIIGIGIIADGIAQVVRTMQNRDSISGSALHILLAVITIALGLVVVFNPFQTMSLIVKIIGIIMIYNAVTNFFLGKAI